ncbi:MAG TPA: thiolase domain-containing protein [Candidatus Caldiarchaeum subterraneum]|uniref:Thiolase domain-containing protein n=1 Tax=Caldiarchaeum subterraneum TaxID=311458 RepID=A0A832ZV28_CALS0|nr:thiolase domain-containing protein [Candidatus Caldarchaeum subterraneum]
MRRVAVIGVGMTRFGKLEDRSLMDLLAEASIKAMKDAGVDYEEFDSVYVGNMLGSVVERQTAIATALVDRLSLFPAAAETVENGPAAGASAVKNGFQAVASGLADLVLVVGGEKMTSLDTATLTDYIATMTHPEAEYMHGATLASLAALLMKLYEQRYGVTEEHVAMVAVKNHRNALKNPYAHLRREITLEEALQSKMVAEPLRMYYSCPISDGAAAAILCPLEKAGKYTDKPVEIKGIGHATDYQTLHEREDPAVLKSCKYAAEQAYRMAGLSPKGIDVAELHDAFSILEIVESEDVGFFKKGQGHLAVEQGVTELDGVLPINPSGGLKARGHPVGATGVAQVVELVWQLRGEAGERQISKNAKRGLACNFGGFGNNTLVHILEAIRK